jgi:hypothetical protein
MFLQRKGSILKTLSAASAGASEGLRDWRDSGYRPSAAPWLFTGAYFRPTTFNTRSRGGEDTLPTESAACVQRVMRVSRANAARASVGRSKDQGLRTKDWSPWSLVFETDGAVRWVNAPVSPPSSVLLARAVASGDTRNRWRAQCGRQGMGREELDGGPKRRWRRLESVWPWSFWRRPCPITAR